MKRKPQKQKSAEKAPQLDEEELETADSSSEFDDSEIEEGIDTSVNLPALSEAMVPELADLPIPSHLSDPLKRYMAEVGRHPLLEPEEEARLAKSFVEKQDQEAFKRLVTANLRLVVKIAMEYRSIYTNVLDLVQEGNVGLMKAVTKYDPTKGVRLGYYASFWIRSYILKYLLDNFRLVRIGTTQAQKKLFFNLMRLKEKLEAQGIAAEPKLIASELNVKEKDVVEMSQRLGSSGSEVSMDRPVHPGAERPTAFKDLLVDPSESADTSIEKEELIRVLKNHLPEFQKTLEAREKNILKHRLLAEEPKTLQEIADQYGLTRERARQIEAQVIEKLRKFLSPYLR